MIPDRDIYHFAATLIDRYGKQAPYECMLRALKNDVRERAEERALWNLVAMAAKLLLRNKPAQGECLH